MTTITALVSRPPESRYGLETLELADPLPDEVLVEVAAIGLCHADVSVLDGGMPMRWPAVLGHEGAGVVVEVGSNVRDLRPGDRVLGHAAFCGHCEACFGGHPMYCESVMPLNFSGVRPDGTASMTAADGSAVYGDFFAQSAFASHALVRAASAVKLPDEVDLRTAGAFGCSTQTGAGVILNTFRVRPGDSVVVAGTRSVGLAAVMAAAASGATRIIAVDILPSRLDAALDVGATHAIDGRSDDVTAQIVDAIGAKADFAFDTTGVPDVIVNLATALKNRGDLALAGFGLHEAALQRMPLFGKTIHSTMTGDTNPHLFLPRLLNLYLNGKFPIDRIVTHHPLADIESVIDDTTSGKLTKPVLTVH